MTRHHRKASDRSRGTPRAAVVVPWAPSGPVAVVGMLLLLLAGCADPDDAVTFDADHPAARIRAIQQVAREEDRQAIPNLIQALGSEDPMERILAIRTLEKFTGQTMGYDHAAPSWEREEAIQRWVEWSREQGLADPEPGADLSSSPDSTRLRPAAAATESPQTGLSHP